MSTAQQNARLAAHNERQRGTVAMADAATAPYEEEFRSLLGVLDQHLVQNGGPITAAIARARSFLEVGAPMGVPSEDQSPGGTS